VARIQNHKYTIEEAFRECFYVVPDYQREYVWTEKEVQQLLDDVDEQLASGNSTEYFVGMILVSPTDQRGHYEVIDGQQRLTTFFLQLCALKNLFGSEPQAQLLNGLISTSFIGDGGNVLFQARGSSSASRGVPSCQAIPPIPKAATSRQP
jgi:hypothetical protein